MLPYYLTLDSPILEKLPFALLVYLLEAVVPDEGSALLSLFMMVVALRYFVLVARKSYFLASVARPSPLSLLALPPIPLALAA